MGEPMHDPDEQWLFKHRDKIVPLMYALDRAFVERIRHEQINWRLMRHKSGLEFMVARLHVMDYWLDPTTGDLHCQEHGPDS
jgi:hypothetical protein